MSGNRWKNVKVLKQNSIEVKNEPPASLTKVVTLSKEKGENFNYNSSLSCKTRRIDCGFIDS